MLPALVVIVVLIWLFPGTGMWRCGDVGMWRCGDVGFLMCDVDF